MRSDIIDFPRAPRDLAWILVCLTVRYVTQLVRMLFVELYGEIPNII